VNVFGLVYGRNKDSRSTQSGQPSCVKIKSMVKNLFG